MIPLALPPIWDVDQMADEVHRVAKKGCHAVTFSENPEKLGYPSIHNEHWDPFWKACSEENTIVCLHIGSSSQVVVTSIEAPVDTLITLQPINIVQAAADLVWSPLLRKFPDLTFALSEGGIGWIPYFLERIDAVYKNHRAWTHQDFGDKLPSEVFSSASSPASSTMGSASPPGQAQCGHDHLGVRLPAFRLHLADAGRLAGYLGGVPAEDIAKITHENALRLFSFDAFGHVPKRATVGALRAQATDVDLGYRSSARLKKEGTETVSVLSLAATLPSAS